jgi:hypothetical protein
VVSRTSDPDFDIPTTVAEAGNTLYLVKRAVQFSAHAGHGVLNLTDQEAVEPG